jgi:hypothetical protein
MDRYHRVEKPRADKTIDENEIRITSQGRMRSYISYAMTLLQVLLLSITIFIFSGLYFTIIGSGRYVIVFSINSRLKI